MLDVTSTSRRVELLRDASDRQASPQITHPSSLNTRWVTAHTSPQTADNGGSTILVPTGITSENSKILYVNQFGTSVLLSLKYPVADAGSITAPVIQVFGFDRSRSETPVVENPIPMQLWDANDAIEHTLTIASATDVQLTIDGTAYAFTKPIELDMQCSTYLQIAIKTAVTNSTGSSIVAKVK